MADHTEQMLLLQPSSVSLTLEDSFSKALPAYPDAPHTPPPPEPSAPFPFSPCQPKTPDSPRTISPYNTESRISFVGKSSERHHHVRINEVINAAFSFKVN